MAGRPVEPAVLQRMNDRQAHRGPDGEGFLLSWPGAGGFENRFLRNTAHWNRDATVRVALGHRRLAILDLSERGLQPMSCGGQRLWIAFNGEIYNYRELRSQLKAQGHEFTTETDTEVLIQAYAQWGEECVLHLEGMYAFAIWDSARARMFCARDRLGIKPFYYATPEGYFAFASEVKALVDFPGLDRAVDDEIAVGFLIHGNCDYSERTILREIKALPAAHTATIDLCSGQISIRPYWRLEPQAAEDRSDEELIGGLQDLLVRTMRTHLNSDVRAGSCLSGGLDSSTIVALAGSLRREQPEAAAALGDRFFTFTSCWDYPELDEREYALSVAGSAGATPQLVFPTAEDFWESFERMAWHEDMPFSGPSYYAQWRVMRAAKEAGIKVLIDGQGGDEVFGGYAKFRYAYLASLLRSGRLSAMARELGATLRQGDRYVLNLRNGYRYLPRRARAALKVDSLLNHVLRPECGQWTHSESTPATRWWRNAAGKNGRAGGTLMQRIQVDDIVLDTLPTLLRLEDRASMAFSLEARVPFLDHKLVEYGLSLPDHLKVRNGWSKFAVRQSMRGLLPENVRMRKTKLGFAAPDRRWLVDDLREKVHEFVSGDLRSARYLEPKALRRWYRSAAAATANTESYLGLFRVLSLEMWMRAFNVS